jgi:hypothetical protein
MKGDARDALVGGAVAEIEKEIEALLDPSNNLCDRRGSPEVLDLPVRIGIEGPWIAGPVIGRKGVREKLLVGQEANAHRALSGGAAVALAGRGSGRSPGA